jgi:hypothetical protein
MNIHFIEPLSKGISRMRHDLFQPFDIKKWFIVGFTAFLAGLMDGGFSGNLYTGRNSQSIGKAFDPETILYFPQKAWQWLINHPGWAIFIAVLLFLTFVLSIILTWLSCRGKFMFLDNVVHRQCRVVAPWYEYRKEGNSFFLFSLIWGVIVFAIVVASVAFCFVKFQSINASSGNIKLLLFPFIFAVLGFIAFSLINLFLFSLLKNFVILIMYRDRISTLLAIQKFVPLFLSHFIYFLGYELFLLILLILIGIGILIAGCCTCCIGFLFLMIPYINAVLLLPIPYSLQAFSIEFLAQFGPEYQIFKEPAVVPPTQPAIG